MDCTHDFFPRTMETQSLVHSYVIIHLVNVFRISGLSILLLYFPKHWQFTHDYIFRPFFYVVMFLLWVWWVEKFRNKGKNTPDGKKQRNLQSVTPHCHFDDRRE